MDDYRLHLQAGDGGNGCSSVYREKFIPLGGPASAGSHVSLPALTTLGIGLTDLPTVEVFSA